MNTISTGFGTGGLYGVCGNMLNSLLYPREKSAGNCKYEIAIVSEVHTLIEYASVSVCLHIFSQILSCQSQGLWQRVKIVS